MREIHFFSPLFYSLLNFVRLPLSLSAAKHVGPEDTLCDLSVLASSLERPGSSELPQETNKQKIQWLQAATSLLC